MKYYKLTIGTILLSLCFNQAYGQSDSLKTNWDKLIVGKWVKKINKTEDGKKYDGLKCLDTIEYFNDGRYVWNMCGINESGKWKISKERSRIVFEQRESKYWEKELNQTDLGEMESPLLKLTETELVTRMIDEEKGWINEFYFRIK
ncbi:hypothetical protein [Algibacter luteus]|uniref:hypothetical protein n=1 Tax=Algibacter luteus TaxID=1178825 RepID=UPI002594092D|nr:hypothetical protein [Algibacter luteus]WJJ96524.1 hypothetical protein O5O44_15025 [Algibacter luteus]